MTRKTFLSAVSLLLAAGAYASVISPEQALTRLEESGLKRPVTRGGGSLELSLVRNGEGGNPAVYVFNNAESGGYYVLSADDLAYPVLGYSDHGSLTEADMTPDLEWWLGEYARQIEYAASHGAKSGFTMPSTRAGLEPIAPLIKTQWDQGAPYYNQCPLVGVDRAYTGCVATAMAQVMNYWQYPEVGTGQVGYEASSISKRLSMNFGNKKFEWGKMLDEYEDGEYSDEEADAVAYLMKACGYSVKMDYGTDSSGALAMNITGALKRYFKYDPNMHYELRQFYSATKWSEMIYDNLKEVGPLLYGGASMLGGGHSFVLDGYDGNGYFHFNWGWSGMSNGYFSLDALNPSNLGSGGGTGGGYNFTQDAVFGIQPPTGLPAEHRPLFLTQTGSLAGYIEEGVLYFDLFAESGCMWVNYNPETLKVGFGAIFKRQGGVDEEPVKVSVSNTRFSIQPGYGTDPEHLAPQVKLSDLNLADGYYDVTFATYELGTEDPEWVPVRTYYQYYDHIILKKDGDDYSVQVYDVAGAGISSAEIVGDLYYGCSFTVKATITNEYDIELTRGVAPAFAYNGALCFLGESIMVTVPPHSSVEREWTTQIYAMQNAPDITEDTEVVFTFFDEMSYNIDQEDFQQEVVMKANPGPPVMSCWAGIGPKITNATPVKEIIDGRKQIVYHVEDKNDIRISAYIGLESGYCNYPVYACVVSPDQDDSGNVALETYAGTNMLITQTGVRKRFSTNLGFSTGKTGTLYSLLMGYGYGGQLQAISGPSTYFRIVGNYSGVGAVEEDGALELVYDSSLKEAKASSESGIAAIEVYGINGTLLKLSGAGTDTVSLQDVCPGIVLIRACDNDGNVRSAKVVL